MGGQFAWMRQERVDAEEAAADLEDQAQEVADSVDPGGEVDTMVTGDMVTGVMVTGPSEVETGALEAVAADTGVVVVDTPRVAATEITGVRDTVTALEPTVINTTAMLRTSKHLPDSRSSLGWLYFKDALLKKNVHVLLLTLVFVVLL